MIKSIQFGQLSDYVVSFYVTHVQEYAVWNTVFSFLNGEFASWQHNSDQASPPAVPHNTSNSKLISDVVCRGSIDVQGSLTLENIDVPNFLFSGPPMVCWTTFFP